MAGCQKPHPIHCRCYKPDFGEARFRKHHLGDLCSLSGELFPPAHPALGTPQCSGCWALGLGHDLTLLTHLLQGNFGGSSEGDQTESSLGRQEDASELSLLGQVNRQKCQIHHRRDAKCPAGHQRGPRAPGQAGELPGTAGGDVQVANLPPHSMSPAFLDPVPTRVGGFGGSRRQIQAQNAKPYVRKKSQGILDQKHIWGVSQWRGEANGELHPLT